MTAQASGARLGVDVGGTFTDLVLDGPDGVQVAKVPSTPDDQAEGILDGVARLDLDVPSLQRFVHGTTVATNAVLERAGARVVLVTTAGFADLLAIGRQTRRHLYDLDARRPDPVVTRGDAVEVAERVGADGEVVLALADDEVARVTETVATLEPGAVAVSLLFGFLRPDHEQRLAAALRDHLGDDVPVSVATDLLPTFREVERTSTVALNAYVAPVMARYLGSLQHRLDGRRLSAAVEVMRSGGGTSVARTVEHEPVHTLLSGPAAGAWGAAAVGATAGVGDLIGLDVGGTSTDVTLVLGGRPSTTAEGAIDGLPFAVTATDVHTIGAGGGSLAWIDDGGALRVGPRSAGAVPGPACYGRGGTEPTVTDANLVLGRLDPDVRLGGDLPLRPDLARAAVARLADRLGQDVEATARGILDVTDAQMVRALRVVSVERGIDPRRLTLVPAGGAGPLHQAALARDLGCARVLVPPNPGVLSALGLLAAPITVDRARSRVTRLTATDAEQLATWWDELAADARATISDQGSEVAGEARSADLRYRGQAFELEVTVDDPVTPERLEAALHEAHRERYGYDLAGEPVELVTLRVRVEGPAQLVPLPRWDGDQDLDAATLRVRDVDLGDGPVPTAVVDRTRLKAGTALQGPAVLLGPDSTVAIAAWQRGSVDDHGCLHLEATTP